METCADGTVCSAVEACAGVSVCGTVEDFAGECGTTTDCGLGEDCNGKALVNASGPL